MSVSSSQETASAGLLPSQRYMGVNRFSTRGGIAGAQWEEQWTHREYNMLARTGFRVSSLLRRTDLGGKVQYGDDGQDYMAMTVFDSKENFMDWKKKYSFNEAHAGGGPVGFVMSFFDTLKVLKGSPAGSGWEAPLAISAGGGAFEYRDRDAAGRAVSDGQRPLGTECFVHEERFRVPSGSEHDFEQLRNSMGKEAAGAAGALPGLAGAYVLRRDPGFGHGGDDGFNYAVMTVWKSEADYQAWEASPAAQAARESQSGSISGPATTVFWEGTQSCLSPDGV